MIGVTEPLRPTRGWDDPRWLSENRTMSSWPLCEGHGRWRFPRAGTGPATREVFFVLFATTVLSAGHHPGLLTRKIAEGYCQ